MYLYIHTHLCKIVCMYELIIYIYIYIYMYMYRVLSHMILGIDAYIDISTDR